MKSLKEKGITLIALIVTIVILLILAGISIAMLTGDNGILAQVQMATEENGKATVIEQARLDILTKQTEEKGQEIYKENIRQILEKYFEYVPKDFTLDTVLHTKIEYGDYEIKVSEIYIGELLEKPMLAGDVLIPDENGVTDEEKSPYVLYNNIICRVLYNDKEHGVQIITLDNINDSEVILGYSDDTVNSTDFVYNGSAMVDEDFKKAAASYNKAVETLNNKAKQYQGEIAIDARCLGSMATISENGTFCKDTTQMYNNTNDFFITYDWNDKFKINDTNYIEDLEQINALELNITQYMYTWLASRSIEIEEDSEEINFSINCLTAGGAIIPRMIFSIETSGSGQRNG